ncbi:MAG: F0F1 ATP synthase subunit alpha, partial [Acidimicrobiales bacterium]
QAQLDRGYRLTELLKQPQNEPVPVEEQVLVVYAGTNGWVDTVEVSEVRRFESEVREYFRSNAEDLLAKIRDTGELPDTDAIDAKLSEFLETFDTGSAE